MPQAARAAHADRSAARARARPEPQPPPRRTVTITGRPEGPRQRHLQAVEPGTTLGRRSAIAAPARGSRLIHIERRRPPRSAHERLGSQPDRLAMWALLMALLLIVVVAATSSHP
jgi:hypothetical protein